MCLESALKRCFEFYKLVLKIRNDDYTIILLVKIRFSCCFSKWCWFEYIVLYSIWVQLYHFLCRQIPSSEFVLEFSFKSFSVYFVLFRSLFRCIDVPSSYNMRIGPMRIGLAPENDEGWRMQRINGIKVQCKANKKDVK